jgi:hypothetical protein
MTTVTGCIVCHGHGTIEFSEEHGGPVCPHCGGKGWITPELLTIFIASILDHPSVYMSGPSKHSMKRAKKIVELLQHEKIMPSDAEIAAANVKAE